MRILVSWRGMLWGVLGCARAGQAPHVLALLGFRQVVEFLAGREVAACLVDRRWTASFARRLLISRTRQWLRPHQSAVGVSEIEVLGGTVCVRSACKQQWWIYCVVSEGIAWSDG